MVVRILQFLYDNFLSKNQVARKEGIQVKVGFDEKIKGKVDVNIWYAIRHHFHWEIYTIRACVRACDMDGKKGKGRWRFNLNLSFLWWLRFDRNPEQLTCGSRAAKKAIKWPIKRKMVDASLQSSFVPITTLKSPIGNLIREALNDL